MPRQPPATAAPPDADPGAAPDADPALDWDDTLSVFGPDPHRPAAPAPAPAAASVDGTDGPLSGARAALERLSTWVPIRSLSRRHRHRIIDHLLALDEHDRYMRFGYPASDAQIRKYGLSLDFGRDEVLGIFNRHLRLIALAHLAYELPGPGEPPRRMAEFGVSVLPHARSRGLGRRLFDAAALHARNRGIDTLFIHALSENRPMLRIAAAAGALVERDGSESAAWLRLPPDTMGSKVEQALDRHLGELDFQFKRQAQVISGIVEGVAELKAHFESAGRAAKE